MDVKNQIEIERKYLVDVVGEIPNPRISDICQTYLVSDDGSVRRVRCRQEASQGAEPRYYYTAKRRLAYDRSYEHEEEISESRYRQLLAEADPSRGMVRKQRIVFYYENQCFELDCFFAPVVDHLLLEIEGAETAESVIMPPFLRVVADVTGLPDYSNSRLARRVVNEMTVQHNVSLRPYNTFGIDACADSFVTLHNEANFRELIQSGMLRQKPFFILGGGSNVVFADRYKGLVVHPHNKGIHLLEKRDGYCYVEACAGEVWADFVRYCIACGWHGLENLAAIPGTVGAAPVQNVGAYGREAKDVISRVHLFYIESGTEEWMDAADCDFDYRWSVFKGRLKGKCLIDRVVFRLSESFEPCLTYKALANAFEEQGISHPSASQVANAVTAIRDAKLPNPSVIGSAGSFFKNPVVDSHQAHSLLQQYPDMVVFPVDENHYKLAAGWLIDHCGWKGRNCGTVGVYPKQALVLVNNGDATGADVKILAHAIIDDVYSHFGVTLECEAIFVE